MKLGISGAGLRIDRKFVYASGYASQSPAVCQLYKRVRRNSSTPCRRGRNNTIMVLGDQSKRLERGWHDAIVPLWARSVNGHRGRFSAKMGEKRHAFLLAGCLNAGDAQSCVREVDFRLRSAVRRQVPAGGFQLFL